MAENKTKKTVASVDGYIDALEDNRKRYDSRTLIKMMGAITKQKPKMWGASLIGFGDHHYKYESGREGDIFEIGFSPRKSSLVLYSMNLEKNKNLLEKLGKYKTGKGCLYIKTLDDVDIKILKLMMENAYKEISASK